MLSRLFPLRDTFRALRLVLDGKLFNMKKRLKLVGEHDHHAYNAGGYCPRCDGCGEDGCCRAEKCDGGVFCAGYYGDAAERERTIREREMDPIPEDQ